MAGRPRTRAKREAAAAAAGVIPDAVPLHTGANAPASARAHARRPVHTRMPLPGFIGNQTRAAADDLEAERLRNVASQIRPGVTIRIERTRPAWCAGFCEEYPIDDSASSIAELFTYVRDTYGGQRYRLTVVSSSGVDLAEGSFPVAAPPRDRGRPIDRRRWEGDLGELDAPRVAAAPPATSHPDNAQSGFAQLVLELLRDSNRSTLESVREMTNQTRAQTNELVQAVVQTRTEDRRERSLATQLAELSDASRAVDKVGRQLFGAARRDDDPDAAADRESSLFFKKAVAKKFFGIDDAPQGAPAQAQQQPQQQRRRVSIPDAPATTQPNGKGN